MKLEEAKKFIGKKVMYRQFKGKLIRVAHPFNNQKMIVGEIDDGLVVNIDLLKFLYNNEWKYIT